VAITTPSGTHYALASQAIAAGAHVLVEKPLTLSLTEADSLLAAARDRGVRVAVGHIYRFFPLVQALEKDLRAGKFGRILQGDVKVRWGHDQAYYDQAAWRGTWAQDGGALMNQSIHALDLMTWLLGSPVREVSGWIDRQTHKMEAEDFGLAMLRLENGSYCQVEGTTSTDPHRQEASFYILGTEGEIRGGIMGGKPFMEIRDRRGHPLTGAYLRRFLREKLREGGLPALLQLKNPHSALYGDLVRSIREGGEPLADGMSGRQAVELILAIYQSALTARPVSLPVRDFTLDEMKGYFPPFSS
jgi:UDP-N-acetyl-2-amino-2-deoxyglucuronate dehydrogenase